MPLAGSFSQAARASRWRSHWACQSGRCALTRSIFCSASRRQAAGRGQPGRGGRDRPGRRVGRAARCRARSRVLAREPRSGRSRHRIQAADRPRHPRSTPDRSPAAASSSSIRPTDGTRASRALAVQRRRSRRSGCSTRSCPTARPGYSFLIIISVEFTPIQLGIWIHAEWRRRPVRHQPRLRDRRDPGRPPRSTASITSCFRRTRSRTRRRSSATCARSSRRPRADTSSARCWSSAGAAASTW